MKLTDKRPSIRRKTCPSATLSTTNPTQTDPGSNPSLRDGRPAANSLSHGAALDEVRRTWFKIRYKYVNNIYIDWRRGYHRDKPG
jgi:hypothetical protein